VSRRVVWSGKKPGTLDLLFCLEDGEARREGAEGVDGVGKAGGWGEMHGPVV
jgi:hypothetical protein